MANGDYITNNNNSINHEIFIYLSILMQRDDSVRCQLLTRDSKNTEELNLQLAVREEKCVKISFYETLHFYR